MHYQEAIKKLVKEFGSQYKLALRLGCTPQAVQKWAHGSQPRKDLAAKIDALLSELAPQAELTLQASGTISVPRLGIEAGAGPGIARPEGDWVVESLEISRDWLRRLTPSRPAALRVICAKGDSMAPLIADGDLLLVDTATKDVDREGVYVVAVRGELLAKRIQRTPAGLLLLSDNKAYPTIQVTAEECESIAISGRVLTVWNRKSL